MERTLENLESLNEQLIQRNEELISERLDALYSLSLAEAKIEHLARETAIHAQEARTQRSIVHEVYQIISGGKGEPGDWNGAEPVRKAFEALQNDNADLRRQLVSMRAA